MLLLIVLIMHITVQAQNQSIKESKEQSLVQRYAAYLNPEHEILAIRDRSSQHYRINDSTVLAILYATAKFYPTKYGSYEPVSNDIISSPDRTLDGWVYRNSANDVFFYFDRDASRCLVVDADGRELLVASCPIATQNGSIEIDGNTLSKHIANGTISVKWIVAGTSIQCEVLSKNELADQQQSLLDVQWFKTAFAKSKKPDHSINQVLHEAFTVYSVLGRDDVAIVQTWGVNTLHWSNQDGWYSSTLILVNINASESGRVFKSSPTATPSKSSGYLRIQNQSATGCTYGYRSWTKYPLTSLSCVQSIDDVDQYVYCYALNEGTLDFLNYDIYRVVNEPVGASGTTLWNDIADGTQYENDELVSNPPDWEWSDIPADNDILNAITSPGWFALGYMVDCNENDASYYAEFRGVGQTNPPYLAVQYTTRPIPSVPSLSSPSTGSTCVSLTVTFDWGDVTNAESYRLQVDNDPGYGSPAIDRILTTSQYSAQSGELSSATTYYWRVRAQNCAGNSQYATSRSFTTTEPAPGAPVLISPPSGSTCVSLPVTLDWNPVSYAAFYHLQVDDNSGFTSPVIDESNLTSSQYTISTGLSNSVIYYWRVRARNSCGLYGSWNGPANFTTTPSTPGTPTLSSPPNGGSAALPITFAWNAASSASSYHLEVDNNPDFSSPEVNQSSITTTQHTVATGLSIGTTYSWRVRASNSCSIFGNWSSVRTLNIITSVEEIKNVIPQSYSLEQNYPNPFNPVSTIEFSLPKQSRVTVIVYDVLGRELEKLVDEDLHAGVFRTTWDATHSATGLYYYRLVAVPIDGDEPFVQTRKMLLLR